jgi:hypothetical protein
MSLSSTADETGNFGNFEQNSEEKGNSENDVQIGGARARARRRILRKLSTVFGVKEALIWL